MLSLVMAVGTVSCAPDQIKTGPTSPSSDEGTCLRYGLVPGTTAYTNCIQREIDARRTGKLGPTYDQRLIAPRWGRDLQWCLSTDFEPCQDRSLMLSCQSTRSSTFKDQDMLSRLASIVVFVPSLAAAQDAQQGREIAHRWCSSCQVVDRSATEAPANRLPTFPGIAANPPRSTAAQINATPSSLVTMEVE
jgi:hypothetical protein